MKSADEVPDKIEKALAITDEVPVTSNEGKGVMLRITMRLNDTAS